ncbi:MAG: hypothetical protein HRT88_13385, partial [Lentisphaeraceae bacterium]|nr:hypothetical protein [Lentisphaeraceae bacterium]
MKSIPMMPALSILIDGNDPGFDRGLHLIEMQIQQKLNFPAQCWLKLSLEETLAVPTCCRAGATVEIFVLENSNRNLLFKGRLTGRDLSFDASQGTILHLKAYDAFYQLRINSDVKSYEQTSVGDLFREHCAGLPLTTEAYADSATINQLYQTGQSHYDLLIERCSRAGLFIAPGPGILSLMDRSGIARQFVLERGGNLISFTISESALRSVANVQISGWLPSNNEAVTGESCSAF